MIAFTNEKVLRDIWLLKFDMSVDGPYTIIYFFRVFDDGWRVTTDVIRELATQVIEETR